MHSLSLQRLFLSFLSIAREHPHFSRSFAKGAKYGEMENWLEGGELKDRAGYLSHLTFLELNRFFCVASSRTIRKKETQLPGPKVKDQHFKTM